MFVISLYVVVYGFHRVHAKQQFAFSKKNDSDTDRSATGSLSGHVISHTLFTCFLLLFSVSISARL